MGTSTILRRATFLLVAAALMAPLGAAAETNGWGGGATAPTMADLIPKMRSEEAYSERYNFEADLEGGGSLKVNFTISNLGLSDGSAQSRLRIDTGEDVTYSYKEKYGSGDWSYGEKSFKLQEPKTTIEGSGESTFTVRHTGKHKGETVEVELTFQSPMPMWQPGGGTLQVSDSDYYTVHLLGMRSSVDGQMTIGDETYEVTAERSGYADHVSTNIAPYSLAKRIAYSRVYDDDHDVFVIWRNIQLTEQYGGTPETYIVVGYKDQIVFDKTDVDFKHGDIESDGKTGYPLPYSVQLDASQGDDEIKLVMRGESVKRKDLLKSVGRFVRVLASSVTKPYHFAFDGTYALQMNIGGAEATVRGDARYVFDHLN
jgi:hypothetical protein